MNVSVLSSFDAQQFLKSAKCWLNQDESGNNTILSIAYQAGKPGSLLRPPFWFALSVDTNGIFGTGVFAIPDGLVLSDMPESHCIAVVEELLKTGIMPERIYASSHLASLAAGQISKVNGRSFRKKKYWRALKIERFIKNYTLSEGDLRKANEGDMEAIIMFGKQYDLENPSVVKAADYFVSRLKQGDLYVWVSDKSSDIRSVLALSGRTDRVVRISGVFTPGKYRGRGYASSSIVRATNIGLSSGFSAVTLVVDISDNVAVDIYSRLGFEPVHDRVELAID